MLRENDDNLENTTDLTVLSESIEEVSLHSALERNEEITTKDKSAHNEYFVSEAMLTNQSFETRKDNYFKKKLKRQMKGFV